MKHAGYFLFLALLLSACSEPVLTPKPRAYPKVEYPERAYLPFEQNACDFSFEYPAYAVIQKDSAFFDKAPPHPCWFNIHFPGFDAMVHCSYYEIGTPKSLERLKSDAFEMVDWHNKKANYIEEKGVRLPNGTTGFVFNIEGPAASPFQFYLTDSTRHFLRGALYFNTAVNPDSIAPVLHFVREDILHMIETFQWK